MKTPNRLPASSAIDVSFDFRSDTPPGRDPDARSPRLRQYHKILWSKRLPNGAFFELKDTTRGSYLHHQSSALGEFSLASDAVVPTFSRERRLADIIKSIPQEEREAFQAIGYTIGGMMVFPGNKVDGKSTLNVARGFHPRIKDRFDLTVECIRRHYRNESSPLSEVLRRYEGFFRLFGDFRGFVEFFLLQDLVSGDCTAVRFFMDFNGFEGSPFPKSMEEYCAYRQLAIGFLKSRNNRIRVYSTALDRIP